MSLLDRVKQSLKQKDSEEEVVLEESDVMKKNNQILRILLHSMKKSG